MDLKDVKQLVGHLESLRAKRLAQQRELGRLILPSRGLFQGEDAESLRESNLFNPAANRALRKAAAGMTQAITPAGNPWFKHAFLLRQDREATGGNEYVDAVDNLLRTVLSAGGFYRAIHSFNKELLGFGCALLGCEESPRTVARYFCQTCGTYCVALDEDGDLDAVARRLLMTPRELARRFGEDRLSDISRQKLKKDSYDPVPVRHVVQRRAARDPERMDRSNMPWGSWWYEEGGASDFLDVGGFRAMPFFFTVWEEARGVYGTGPGDEALADQKGIEGWELRKAVGVEKMIDPVLVSQGPLKAQMLEQSGAVAIQSLFELAAPMLQAAPDLADKIDFEQAIDELAQRLGVPATVIRSDETVAAMRRQRAEAQAAQRQQTAEAQMLQQVAALGNVKTQGTVAGEVLGTVQGGEPA